jgi:hypothetical protein
VLIQLWHNHQREEIHGTCSPSSKFAIDKLKVGASMNCLIHVWNGYYQVIAHNKDDSISGVIYIDVTTKTKIVKK